MVNSVHGMNESTIIVTICGGKKAMASRIPRKLFISILEFDTDIFPPFVRQKTAKYPSSWNRKKAKNRMHNVLVSMT